MQQSISARTESQCEDPAQHKPGAKRRFPSLDQLPSSWLAPQAWRRRAASILVPTYLGLIYGLPAMCLLGAFHARGVIAFCMLAMTPFVFLATAIVLSLPHQSRVVEGRMPVDTAVPAYFHRRLYGLCWTTVFYSGPIYHFALSIPSLRRALFFGFGYRGSMDFTVYPDTWIRDLPLLDIGEGSYLSNKATVGTNMIFLRHGKKWIEVGSIRLGPRVMVGHMALLGPGVELGADALVGVVARIGRRVTVGAGAVVGDAATIDHGASIAPAAVIRTCCYVGMGRHVAAEDGMEPQTALMRRAVVRQQA